MLELSKICGSPTLVCIGISWRVCSNSAGPCTQSFSDAAEMRWSLRIYIPNKFPGDAAAAAAATETTLRITGGLNNKLLHL